MEKCFFCDSTDTVEFNEHYVFCKDCTAIYTDMILKSVECSCFGNNNYAPVIERYPWFVDWFLKYENDYPFVTPTGKCSSCGEDVIADGW